jgi:hypothetical protein
MLLIFNTLKGSGYGEIPIIKYVLTTAAKMTAAKATTSKLILGLCRFGLKNSTSG